MPRSSPRCHHTARAVKSGCSTDRRDAETLALQQGVLLAALRCSGAAGGLAFTFGSAGARGGGSQPKPSHGFAEPRRWRLYSLLSVRITAWLGVPGPVQHLPWWELSGAAKCLAACLYGVSSLRSGTGAGGSGLLTCTRWYPGAADAVAWGRRGLIWFITSSGVICPLRHYFLRC